MSIGPLRTNFSEVSIKMHFFFHSGKCVWKYRLGYGGILSRGRWVHSSGTETEISGERGPLRWRHNGRDGIANHQPHDCLLNRLFRRRSKKTSKLHVTGLCAGNSPVTGEFPVQRASNADNFSIWWRHHQYCSCTVDNLSTQGVGQSAAVLFIMLIVFHTELLQLHHVPLFLRLK